jgi:hypothetical protein
VIGSGTWDRSKEEDLDEGVTCRRDTRGLPLASVVERPGRYGEDQWPLEERIRLGVTPLSPSLF